MISPKKRSRHLCPWQFMWLFDNRFRLKIHSGNSLFSKYVFPGDTVADMGCGIGGMSLELARMVGKSGKVIAVDIQEGALKRVRSRAKRHGLADIIETRLVNEKSACHSPEASFVVSFWVAHETLDPGDYMKKTYSCLKDQGKFMLVEPKLHVNKDFFQQELNYAFSAGYRPIELPDIPLSYAAVLVK